MNPTLPLSIAQPTRVRYGVLAFCCVLSMITYLDRVSFGTVASNVQSEFGLTETQKGMLFTAFALAYAVFEVPTGWLGDKYGARKTLIRIVLWWSVFTVLTGMIFPSMMFAFGLLLTIRFLFGVGEAGAYPNIARAFHNWFPFDERGSVKGAVWMAGRFAGGITAFIVYALMYDTFTTAPQAANEFDPTPERLQAIGRAYHQAIADGKTPMSFADLTPYLKEIGDPNKLTVSERDVQPFVVLWGAKPSDPPKALVAEKSGVDGVRMALMTDGTLSEVVTHWRHIFYIFGAIGAVWCVAWYWWYRDKPADKSGVNAAEIALIQKGEVQHTGKLIVPWGKLLSSVNLWVLCLMYFFASYGWYLNITYFPGYLKNELGIERGDVKWTGQFWIAGLMAGLPLLVGSVSCLIGGFMTDRFIRTTGNRKWGRRLFGVIGHGLTACCFFTAIWFLRSPWMFVGLIAMAAFWNDFTMGAAWASCLDIGKRYSGIVAGCMNTIGNLGGALAGILTGVIIDWKTSGIDPGVDFEIAKNQGWTINICLFGSAYVGAVICWLFFDATKPVVADSSTAIEAIDDPMLPE